MKLVVNLVLGLNRAALAEGLAFADMLRISPRQALEILQETAAYSRVMETKGPKMVSEDFAPQARLRQHLKDVRLMLSQASLRGRKLPFSALHASLLEELVQQGLGDLDNSAIVEALRR
jgi:3-hydroxyisobutyrate dehydrogenase-like beta-hydroxyacid dehydrogenase